MGAVRGEGWTKGVVWGGGGAVELFWWGSMGGRATDLASLKMHCNLSC